MLAEMENVTTLVYRLVRYGLRTGLLPKEESVYATNLILDVLKLDELSESGELPEALPAPEDELAEILTGLRAYAAAHGLSDDDGVDALDRFDTRLMNCLTPRPAQVIAEFRAAYARSPREATDAFYKFCGDCDYIRRYRVKKDMKWQTRTEYGDLDITINLSKPEKDPKAIAAARLAKQSAYPRCALCRENEGYAGRANHPARQTIRLIPLRLQGADWFLQYSPYSYYNEHCIVLSGAHSPMKIDRDTFARLLGFVKLFPHYFVGSNADLPVVGGSILSHEHFQGGRYTFAMERAPIERTFRVPGYEHVRCGIVKWPMSVVRLTGASPEELVALAGALLDAWRGYSDPEVGLLAETDGVPHHTITPIARRKDALYELDLVLRSNITSAAHPLGVFHPHAEYHHIKKENIGLIEVMGLAVLPARLKKELAELRDAMVAGGDLHATPTLASHAEWAADILRRHPEFSAENGDAILREEVGQVYGHILEQCGVFARNEIGASAFGRFLHHAVQAEEI